MTKETKSIRSKNKLTYNWELKSISENGVFAGYASVFNTIDNQNDIIFQGAFSNTIKKNKNIKLLWQHKTNEPIGVFTYMREDAKGLYVEGKLLLDIQRAKEAYALLKEGAVDGLSIGYKVLDSDIDTHTGTRAIKELDLFEISLVTFPANSDAKITQIKADHIAPNLDVFNHSINRAIDIITSM